MTKAFGLFLALLLSACRDDRPPAPTPEQSDQLNEAENLLNEAAEAENRVRPAE